MDLPSGSAGHAPPERGRILGSICEAIGDTPLVRLNRLPAEAGCLAEVLVKLEFFNPLSSVKDRIALAMVEAAERAGRLERRQRDRRAHLRQHRHRAGLRLRRQGLPPDPDHAREHVARAPQDAQAAGRRARADAGGAGHARCARWRPSGSSPSSPARSCSSSSRTRPTRRSIAAPRPRRSGATPAAGCDAIVAGVGTGGTITGCAQALQGARARPALRRRRARGQRRPLGRQARARTRSRASAPASCRPTSTAAWSTRSSASATRPPSPPRGGPRPWRACRSGISSGATIAAALEIGARPAHGRQADRRHRRLQRRALPVDGAVLGDLTPRVAIASSWVGRAVGILSPQMLSTARCGTDIQWTSSARPACGVSIIRVMLR